MYTTNVTDDLTYLEKVVISNAIIDKEGSTRNVK